MFNVIPVGVENFDGLDIQFCRNLIKSKLTDIGEALEVEMLLLISPWENERPIIKTRTFTRSGDYVVQTYPDGSGMGYQKWIWLDFGTSARYHIMSEDFERKSNPNSLVVQDGNTGSPRFTPIPLDGIEARNWTLLLLNNYKEDFVMAMQDAADTMIGLFF